MRIENAQRADSRATIHEINPIGTLVDPGSPPYRDVDKPAAISQNDRELENRQQQLRDGPRTAAHDALTSQLAANGSDAEASSSLFNTIRERSESWRRLLDSMEREGNLDSLEWRILLASWAAWQASVEHLVHALAWIDGRHAATAVLEKLTEPTEVFSRYAHDVAPRLAASEDPTERSAGASSLALASRQLAKSTSLAAEAMANGRIEAGSDIQKTGPSLSDSSPRSLSFYAQERELAARGAPITDHVPGWFEKLSPAAAREARAYRIGQIICQCNRAARYAGRPEIFRPTTTLLQSINALPFVVVVDRESLGTFNDCLYFALYEDAGADNLRYLDAKGGLLKRDDSVCDAIWAVKALRNKMLRHDPDHGGDAGAQESWRQLNASLVKVGIRSWPVTPDDFTALQDALLGRVAVFLETLLERLQSLSKVAD